MSSEPIRHPRIVVGYDGSDDSIAALQFACNEALGRGADIHVVHAIDDSMLSSAWGVVFDIEAYQRTGQGLIDQARQIAAEGGIEGERFFGEVAIGQPTTVLLKASEDASVVVVGRRSEPGEGAMFIGSTGVGLAGQGPCPLIEVSELAHRQPPTGLVSVTVGTADRQSPAVEWGFRRADRLGSRLQIVTVVSRPRGPFFALQGTTDEQMDAAAAEAHRRLETLLEPLRERYPDVDVSISVRKADFLVEEILRVTTESDLLIMGVTTGFPTYSISGNVRAVMANAACPLGIIRNR